MKTITKQKFTVAAVFFLTAGQLFSQNTVRDSVNEKSIDEVVMTGVFDKRMRMNSPIAITALKSDVIMKQAPNSASDLLKNVPGVYVNSSNGEIRNSVSSRGINVGTQDGSFGYEYVSMQEDGLPITNTTYFNYGPDFFLRADATISQLDAVRGGPASITAANAPGGIFNYISKTGGNKFTGEIRTKYGIQGDHNSGLYRTDLNIGGPLGDSWFYNIGGFYRYDLGARPANYPLNNGGQVKGNIVKKYNRGTLKILLKYLQDRNGYSMPILTKDFNKPEVVNGFTNSSSVLLPTVSYTQSNYVEGGMMNYNSSRLVDNLYRSAGINWEHDLGGDWKLYNNAKYSNNGVRYNTSLAATVVSATDATLYALMGGLGLGTYEFKDSITGQNLLTINSGLPAPGSSLPTYTVLNNSLPNQSIIQNGIFMTPLNMYENKVWEIMDQLTVSKKWKNMSFAFGGYFGYSDVKRLSGGSGVALSTMEPNPRLLTATFNGYYNFNPTLGGTYQLTDQNGIGQLAGDTGTLIGFYAKQRQLAAFFGHTWDLTPDLTLDWGVRFENVNVKGYNSRTYLKIAAGLDNNPKSLYDNNVLDRVETVDYNKTLNAISYSAALNYKFSNNFAVYTRFSEGKKSPDLDVYFATNRKSTINLLNPQQRTTQQVEAGAKLKSDYIDLFVTPFYSILKNVPSGGFGQEKPVSQGGPGGFYALPTIYNDFRTKGVEIESTIKANKFFNVRAVATFQKSVIENGNYWIQNSPGMQDDTQGTFTGNETAATPRVMLNVTPNLVFDRFYTFLTWSYLGSRQANNTNAFKMPAFSTFDFGAGYTLNENISFSVNVNNIFNQYGVMSWQRPGSIVDFLAGTEGFTSEMYQKAQTAGTPYFTVANPPRSGFFTVIYKF